MTNKKLQSKRDVILDTWRHYGFQSVGEFELMAIQKVLKITLKTVDTPASIARVMADEGVRLRHPEVLNFDSAWREQKIHELFGPGELDFDAIQTAIDSVSRIDDLFFLFESEGDSEGSKAIVEVVREVKSDLANRKSPLAREVGQWLTVWLQNPQIFSDWLSLRRNSPEFMGEFGQIE
jgi:hypothetical protein